MVKTMAMPMGDPDAQFDAMTLMKAHEIKRDHKRIRAVRKHLHQGLEAIEGKAPKRMAKRSPKKY